MPKIGNTSGPGPINNSPEPKKKTNSVSSMFFNPNVKAKSLKGRVGEGQTNPNMMNIFKKIKSS